MERESQRERKDPIDQRDRKNPNGQRNQNNNNLKCDAECQEDERIDDLQRNGYRIIQKKNGFCFGMDAVLLSGFAQVKP